MQIILLSGGSGTGMWPLSNDARSKQFLRLLPSPLPQERESMVQRVVRQLKEAGIYSPITVATFITQQDSIISQLGSSVNIVTEPQRHNTFPAIALACENLEKIKGVSPDEIVAVIPSDIFTELDFFKAIPVLADRISNNLADLGFIGVRPSSPSTEYGYILPGNYIAENVFSIKKFIEKPAHSEASRMLKAGAFWNAGVFVFKLGYVLDLSRRFVNADSFDDVRTSFTEYPADSFDRVVAEHTHKGEMFTFFGKWKDLGTWNNLSDELPNATYGNVITDNQESHTHIINELDIPLVCIGTQDLVIAASPDGILVSEKEKCGEIKEYIGRVEHRPMYEERRWGTYKVIDYVEYADGYCALTKQLNLNPGASISYQRHTFRDEVWTFINGEGEIVIDGHRSKVTRGMTIQIPKGVKHALKATTALSFIEVQSGSNLVESDIERFEFDW